MTANAIASLLVTSASASAFWGGDGPFGGFSDVANDFFGDAFGDGVGDFNMNASGNGNGRGWGRGYERVAYRGYGYGAPYGYRPYGYAPYGVPYDGAPYAPVAPLTVPIAQ